MDIAELIAIVPQQVVFGLALGAIYALVAIGFSMVYGVLFMINFAHGDVMMVGSMFGLVALTTVLTMFSGAPLIVLVLAMIVAALISGVLGVSIERVAYRPLYAGGSSRLGPLISALGVSLVIENGALIAVGATAKVYPTSAVVAGLPTLQGGGIIVGPVILIILVVAIVSMIAVERLVGSTKWGRGMRALRENRETTALMGVNINRVVSLTFFVGSALAGIGGVLVALYYTETDFLLGWYLGLKAFAAAVLGGIGNIRGAVVGGLLLGVIEALGITVLSYTAQFGFGIGYKDVIAFLVLVAVLIFKPTGLLGERGAQVTP